MRRFSRPSIWPGLWAVVGMAVGVAALMTWLHFSHQRSLRQAMTVVEDVRLARIELAKGFLFVSLANGSDSPFQREHGLVLLDQALWTFEKCTAGLEAHGEDLAVFRARIKEFRANLDAAPENSEARPTPSAPCGHVSPRWQQIRAMAPPNRTDLIRPMRMSEGAVYRLMYAR